MTLGHRVNKDVEGAVTEYPPTFCTASLYDILMDESFGENNSRTPSMSSTKALKSKTVSGTPDKDVGYISESTPRLVEYMTSDKLHVLEQV